MNLIIAAAADLPQQSLLLKSLSSFSLSTNLDTTITLSATYKNSLIFRKYLQQFLLPKTEISIENDMLSPTENTVAQETLPTGQFRKLPDCYVFSIRSFYRKL